ncbi:MAG TPA: response regulator [Chthoniobacterales bacterium]|jgi:CheY-like chemotaxis protein
MEPSSIAPEPARWSILVVEDDVDTAAFLVRFLGRNGYEVRTAGSVGEALKKLEEKPCDALVSDIGLPDGTGWDLMTQAQLPPTVYALAMSGFAMQSHRAMSATAGFREHLTKPFSPKELLRLLREAQGLVG